MAGNLQIPGLKGLCYRWCPLTQTPIPPQQNRAQGRPVELQKMNQPAAQVGIAVGTAQRDALQQPQGVCSRQPAVVAHPAVDAEQCQRQSPFVEADADQVRERASGPGAAEQVQVAVFSIAAMAVVVALRAAAQVDQIACGVMLALPRPRSGGEGPHQRPLALDQTQPVIQSKLS